MSSVAAEKQGESFRAPIPRVNDTVARPRWSVMIPTFHCAHFLGDTLRSVLSQDPGPELMQVEVVDDASTYDDPEAVVRDIGRGRVHFFRQPRNVGQVENFNTCLSRARGHIVHLLHGDDIVRPGYYDALGAVFDSEPDVGAVFCNQIIIDELGRHVHTSTPIEPEAGVLDRWLIRLAEGQRLQTPSIAVRRAIYEQVGGFDARLSYCEDWEMWVRVAAVAPVWYIPDPLVAYRMHQSSNTGRRARTGENIRDLRRGVAINRELLPADVADEVSRTAYRNIALGAIRRARRMLKRGETATAKVHVREAFRTSVHPLVFLQAFKVGVIWFGLYAWRTRVPDLSAGDHG